MKNDIENKLERFKALLEPLTKTMSIGKKQYINSLIEEIVTYINLAENRNKNLEAKLSGFSNSDDYLNDLFKCLDLLQCFGFSEVEFNSMRKDFIVWVLNNYDGLKRKLNWDDLVNIYKMAQFFECLEDRLPNDFTELKAFWDDRHK